MISERQIPKFRNWLERHGAELLAPTNEYELVRFRCSKGVGVIYQGRRKLSTSGPVVAEAIQCFEESKKWDGRGERTNSKNTGKVKRELLQRDGPECFYCGETFTPGELTQEHLLSALHKGPNRIENKALACQPCNREAGHKPLIDKIKWREMVRQRKRYSQSTNG